jgi:hypothetical protein
MCVFSLQTCVKTCFQTTIIDICDCADPSILIPDVDVSYLNSTGNKTVINVCRKTNLVEGKTTGPKPYLNIYFDFQCHLFNFQ